MLSVEGVPLNSSSDALLWKPHPGIIILPAVRDDLSIVLEDPMTTRVPKVKNLSCADCGRMFRGERRRPCSEQLLVLLCKKSPDSTASAHDFVHESCQRQLHKLFKREFEEQQQVGTNFILLYDDLRHV